MKKIKEGDVVTITQAIKSMLGTEVQPIGTVVGVFGDQLTVLLGNNDIWIGSAKFVFKQ